MLSRTFFSVLAFFLGMGMTGGKMSVRTQILMGNIPVTITLPIDGKREEALTHMSQAFALARQIEGEVRALEAGTVDPTTSPHLSHLLQSSRHFSERTGGAFDIFHSGPPDLGGIAKGYMVDAMAGVLRQKGHRHFLINAGGDLWAEGKDHGKPWAIAIQDPTGPPGQAITTLWFSNQGIATSGTYERGNHIMNPSTHRPADPVYSSVSVIAETTEAADALATAGFVMGREAGPFFKGLIGAGEPLQAILIDKAGEIRWIEMKE